MDKQLKIDMFKYYDERAPEYDEFYLGKGPASIKMLFIDYGKLEITHQGTMKFLGK